MVKFSEKNSKQIYTQTMVVLVLFLDIFWTLRMDFVQSNDCKTSLKTNLDHNKTNKKFRFCSCLNFVLFLLQVRFQCLG